VYETLESSLFFTLHHSFPASIVNIFCGSRDCYEIVQMSRQDFSQGGLKKVIFAIFLLSLIVFGRHIEDLH
jgi:hypothetical protein